MAFCPSKYTVELLISAEIGTFTLDETVQKIVKEYFQKEVSKNEENFSNGRFVRNLFDNLTMNHAKRVVNIVNVSKEQLLLITEEDF